MMVVLDRSLWRIGLGVLLGPALVMLGYIALSEDDPFFAALMLGLGTFVIAHSLWPKLSIEESGLVIRNLKTRRVPWSALTGVSIGPQHDHLGWVGRWSNDSRGMGKKGLPGLLIHTREDGYRRTLASVAFQESVLPILGRSAASRMQERILQAQRLAQTASTTPPPG